jgi:hypothetical protein
MQRGSLPEEKQQRALVDRMRDADFRERHPDWFGPEAAARIKELLDEAERKEQQRG